MVALGEIGTFIRGSGLQKKDFVESGVGCIHYGQIYTYYGTFTHTTKSFVSEEFAKKAKMASFGDLVMATTSENVSDVCKVVAWLGKESIAISGDALIIKHNQNAKYMAYLFQTKHFLDFKKMYATGTKVIRISTDNLKKYKFYLPPLEIQQMIVDILDKFDKLVNDLTTGLPAEINARRQQYEYYRDKLLAFRECKNDFNV
ncbi:restriction endonuclease subunit S [Rodentibacter rarus]|uniref:restriction endonuclease subunit S n=1 Tax=Rodentibacter rarus TaxID=1908260 RepID=UPI000986E07C|nr:restriction endonuclease subunit S [Rodentibacter rarus]